MLGEVVHNEHVINDLKNKGLKLIKDFNKIPIINNGILVVQSHGISQKIYHQLNNRKIPYIDSTCTLVKHIHNSIKKLEKEGYYPIIIGNKNHTEVQGIAGHVKKSIIIFNEKEVSKNLFKGINKIGVVFQSTFIKEEADKILKKLKKIVKKTEVIDTICKPTKDRQKELKENSGKHNCILVIGSRTSANTNHLFNIAKNKNKNTFFIEKPEDVPALELEKYSSCFVTSGASTPQYIIDRTIKMIKQATNKFKLFSKKWIPLIDKTISEFFSKKDREIELNLTNNLLEELKKFCLRPGKRLRPLLLILSYIGFSNAGQEKQYKDILNLAAGVELMHSFLLIHDDIIDKAEMRRGDKSFHIICKEKFKNQTYNKRIGEDIALVIGDILFSMVLKIIAKSRVNLKIKNLFLENFSKCYELTGWGQILDSISSHSKKIKTNIKISYKISTYKTAYYTIFYPMLMGYILTGKNNPKTIKKIKDFALPFGIGFQIRDDVLGIFGDKFKTGKSDISDIIEAKFTLLVNTVLNLLKGKNRAGFIKLFYKEKKSSQDIEKIKNIMQKSGCLEKSLKEINQLFNRASENLNKLNIGKNEKEILNDLINNLKRV